MLTLITGTPGAGKSLYTVWEIARRVPGSTVESEGQAIPRRLLSNIKNLVLEHEVIGPDQLENWHEWAQPGDVIIYDEVQEVWRPRSLGTKVPPCIAALETHRHKGVDIVLITQHPMLVDPNIRRLVNQHIHLRRVTKTVAWVYEWDHCSNPGQTRTAIQSRVWFHPKKAYDLYKSAQLHTKPTAKLPKLVWVGVAALAALLYLGPVAYSRIQNSFQPSTLAKAQDIAQPGATSSGAGLPDLQASAGDQPAPVLPGGSSASPVFAGCIARPGVCRCFDSIGRKVDLDVNVCETFNGQPPLPPEKLPDVRPDYRHLNDDIEALSFLKANRQWSATNGPDAL